MGKFFKTQVLRGYAYFNDPPPPQNPPANPPADKTFTQADVDRFLAEDRRKGAAKTAELTKQLETLSQSKSLTEEEKTALQAQLDDLKNQSLTKEQQLTRDLEKATATTKTITETLTKDRDTWQGRYGDLLVRQKITEAAVAGDVVSNEQMLDFLIPKAKVIEVLGEDGKGTGTFNVVIKFNDTDVKTKKDVVLDLTPTETVKRMKELPERFGNLFKSGVQGGVGKKPGGASADADITTMSQAEYNAHRKSRGW